MYLYFFANPSRLVAKFKKMQGFDRKKSLSSC